ncbi:Putative origin recognition complex, subunit 2 [Septoria linicola]|uniref:Origin recognition complex subunit 2 n=1 Tax=Septoria linicola TaxID=215465 RepID=A0A9Q9AQC9_9PEZI|nr:putative origin recognition complex, subunit 2 [Septoria linicola]USW51173.1 Putative origin recognition complex, subunit 2 [Septoria linicola]
MPKRRKVDDDAAEDDDPTPRKTRRSAKDDHHVPAVSSPLRGSETPSSRSILKQTPSKANGLKSVDATPSSLRKVLFATPNKPEEEASGDHGDTPTATRNDRNDRSARRKSQRTLQKQIAGGDDDSDQDDDEHEEAIAQAILGEDEVNEDAIEIEVAPGTPSKTGRPRGRPKGRRRERTPSPPPNLPPHELFFFQNRAGGNKTSANTMSTHLLLNHEDYFAQVTSYQDSHKIDIEVLKQLHTRAFDQWLFELEEGFNICMYGYGSKRQLAMDFAEHIYYQSEKPPKLVVVNGYAPGLTIRDALTSVASVVMPKGAKLPAQPVALLDTIMDTLTTTPPKETVKLIVHSLDHVNLRKAATQGLLARLAAHPSISLVATCDNPNFPLLWDISLASQFKFLYHDATTFAPYTAEIEVVEDVNALLGRSSRRLGGKDGVGYVLKSLPENARSLFRILVAEQLALADTEGEVMLNGAGEDSDPDEIIGVEDEEEAAAEQHTPSKRIRGRGRPAKAKKAPKPPKPVQTAPSGVEYRTLYHKAVEEFVCSSEVNFRTLLKEFHDHQMIESRKDALGTERLVVPFRREELESILEELV